MRNYEIMLVVNGTLSTTDADNVANNCQKNLAKAKDLKLTKLGLKKMAYAIKHISQAYYYLFNFMLDDVSIIKEFNRLTLINKDVLRFLVINLEHNYGYRAIHNIKKIERAKKRAAIYEKQKKEYEEKIKAKKAAAAIMSEVSNKLVDEKPVKKEEKKHE